jgi:hypothetical protein
MKRFLRVFPILVLACSLFVPASYTKPKSKPTVGAGKITIKCPSPTKLKKGITACPDTGCGSVDPNLNKAKNIPSVDGQAETMTIEEMKALADPVPGYAIGDGRDKITALGEGRKITVMAWALVVRKGGAESCNCKLTAVKDTDNHIVLVDPTVKNPTLAKNEDDSETAEFTPRVRLEHPNLSRAKLSPLITAGGNKLLVRITGQLMFDSEHSLGHHLKRHNNWEVHPISGLEYCPKAKKCTAGSNANWKDIEQ